MFGSKGSSPEVKVPWLTENKAVFAILPLLAFRYSGGFRGGTRPREPASPLLVPFGGIFLNDLEENDRNEHSKAILRDFGTSLSRILLLLGTLFQRFLNPPPRCLLF